MILVDTSVWIDVFRRPRPLELARTIDFDKVIVCPPIVQEVLQGIRDADAYRSIRQSLLALPMLESPMSIDVWLEGAQLYRTARNVGITIDVAPKKWTPNSESRGSTRMMIRWVVPAESTAASSRSRL